jgi:hypothetical protein
MQASRSVHFPVAQGYGAQNWNWWFFGFRMTLCLLCAIVFSPCRRAFAQRSSLAHAGERSHKIVLILRQSSTAQVSLKIQLRSCKGDFKLAKRYLIRTLSMGCYQACSKSFAYHWSHRSWSFQRRVFRSTRYRRRIREQSISMTRST